MSFIYTPKKLTAIVEKEESLDSAVILFNSLFRQGPTNRQSATLTLQVLQNEQDLKGSIQKFFFESCKENLIDNKLNNSEVYRISQFYTDLDNQSTILLPSKQLTIEKNIFLNLCSSLLERLESHKETICPFLIGKVPISPTCELSISIENYTSFEVAEATDPLAPARKVVIKYCFPETLAQNFIIPRSHRRKRIDLRSKFINNFLEHSCIKLDYNPFVKFAQSCSEKFVHV